MTAPEAFTAGFWAAFGMLAAVGATAGVVLGLMALADALAWGFEKADDGIERLKGRYKPKRTVEEAIKEIVSDDPIEASAIRDRKP